MKEIVRIFRHHKSQCRTAEIYDLSFISNRNNRYGWLGLHYRHFYIKAVLVWAQKIYVPDFTVAMDLIKYYFCPKEKIVVDRTILRSRPTTPPQTPASPH